MLISLRVPPAFLNARDSSMNRRTFSIEEAAPTEHNGVRGTSSNESGDLRG